MWRRRGDLGYALVVFVIFCIEVIGLGFLTIIFAGRIFGLLPFAGVLWILVAVVVVTAVTLLVLSGHILVYHAMTRSREQQRGERVEAWTGSWITAIYGEGPLPPLTDESAEAGLNLRHLLGGEEGKTLAEGLWQTGVAGGLLRKLHSHRLTDQMEALDGLAKARLPTAFPSLIRMMDDPQPVVRLMAARAAARTASEWTGAGRSETMEAFSRAIGHADLPTGATAEAMLLLEGGAGPVVGRLLSDHDATPRVLRASLDAVGRLHLVEFAYEAAVWISHSDPEVRAAALRALGRLGSVPLRARHAVVIALADDMEFVRIQAARAAAYVPARIAVKALYESLGDRSWWVRRAAAETMLHRGRWGVAALRKAARAHEDRFARDMAAQVLLDGGVVQITDMPQLMATP